MRNLNDYEHFVRIVDHGGIAAAARSLGLPKSTLSKRLAALEAELDARLIQRTSRTFAVTETGHEFYRHAAAMLVEAEAAEHVVRGRTAEPSGTVRITASVMTAQLVLAPVLPVLATAYPKLTLVIEATDRFVDIVQEGYDLALRDHLAPLPDSDLVQRRLATDPVILVAAPHYLEARGTPKRAAELAAHDALLVGPGHPEWVLGEAAGRTARVAPRARFFANDSAVLLDAACEGLGITALPRKLCRPLIQAGKLTHLMQGWTAGEVTTTLLMPHRRGLLPSVRETAEFLAANMRR